MRRRVALVVVWSGLVAAWLVYQRAAGLGPVEAAQGMVDAIRGTWWSLPLFVVAYLVRPLILFPATLMTIAAGILFGPVVGVAATVVGANASALLAYWMARSITDGTRWSASIERGLSEGGGETGAAARWAVRLRRRGFATVLTMRLLFLPYDLVHYAAGVVRVRPLAFLAATAIGSLPATVSFVLAGASLDRIDDGPAGLDVEILAASAALLLLSLGLAMWLRRRERTGNEIVA